MMKRHIRESIDKQKEKHQIRQLRITSSPKGYQPEDWAAPLTEGELNYLRLYIKPELMEKIRQLNESYQARHYTYADLRLDALAQTIHSVEAVRLTQRELHMCRLLMTHAPDPVPFQALIEAWKFEGVTEAGHVIAVYAASLRKKIRAAGSFLRLCGDSKAGLCYFSAPAERSPARVK
jgi:hypothetical protein